jgi:hypothetical protein
MKSMNQLMMDLREKVKEIKDQVEVEAVPIQMN